MTKKEMMRGSAEILAATMIWGYGFTVTRDSLDRIPLPLLMSWRYLIAFAVLAIIFAGRIRNVSVRLIKEGVILGFLLYISQYFQTAALGYADTTAGKVAFITALYVLFVPFLNWAIFRVRPDRMCMLAVCLAVPGLFLLTWAGDPGIGTGDLTALAGSLGLSVHILAGDIYTKRDDVVTLTVFQFGFAFLFSWIVQNVNGYSLSLTVWKMDTIWPFIYLGIFSTMCGFFLQLDGQKRLPSFAVAVLLAMESVFGMLFSVALGGESLTSQGVAGCFLMLAAVLLPKEKAFGDKIRNENCKRENGMNGE